MTQDSSKVPPESYFEEQAALQLLVPRAKLLAALADALGTTPAGSTVTVPRAPTAALLRPFISCPEAELPEAWEAMLRIAATMAGRAVPPAAPGEIVKAIREYLGVHPDLVLGGQVLDSMALELSRIALDYPADRIGALALEELMQLGYTVEAGAILPPRDLPEQACQFFGVRPVGQRPAKQAMGDHQGSKEHQRAQFELAYAVEWAKSRDGGEPPEQLAAQVRSWRSGNSYGNDLPRLRFGWEGYQWAMAGRGCLAQIEEPAGAAPAALAAKPGGMIAVPFDLVVAACSAIDKRRDAPKILAELRQYTTGDLSRAALAAAPQAPSQDAPAAPIQHQGMTIAGNGAAELGKLMREQRNSRLGVYPDGNPNAGARADLQAAASQKPATALEAP